MCSGQVFWPQNNIHSNTFPHPYLVENRITIMIARNSMRLNI